jgi:acetyl-CoA acyltransferase
VRDVAIIGVGLLKFGRFPDKFVHELGGEAVLLACKDAGIDVKNLQLLVSGNLQQANAMVGQRILQTIGQTGIPVVNVANACATGSTAVREAYLAVASGACDLAVGVGSEQMGKMGLLGGRTGDPYNRILPAEGFVGSGTMPAVFGQMGVEHMRKYGTTFEQFVKVAYKNHKHSVNNPNAQYQQEFSIEEITNARMISWPNTLYMCCPTGDGAGAVIVAPADKARQYTSQPIHIAANVLTSDPWQERDLAMFDVNTLTRNAAKQAYEEAGIGPEDLDVVELHDCFATAEMLHYGNLGLCPYEESGPRTDAGEFALGGRLPVNPSGGLLSRGHPLGATGPCGITEIVWQLRGQSGGRQVEGAKVGLAHVIGLGSACTINILKK